MRNFPTYFCMSMAHLLHHFEARLQYYEKLLLAWLCLSVCLRGTTGLQLGGFSWNFVRIFWKYLDKAHFARRKAIYGFDHISLGYYNEKYLGKEFVQNIKNVFYVQKLVENSALCEIMWKKKYIWYSRTDHRLRTRIACCLPKVTETHIEYVIL
jgi:hypothetical protein